MTTSASEPGWTAIAILVGRLILVAFFTMAFYFKFTNIDGTAGYIASAGFPIPTALAWLATHLIDLFAKKREDNATPAPKNQTTPARAHEAVEQNTPAAVDGAQ